MARGGKRTGAGRPTGKVNPATAKARATIRELASKHADTALAALVEIATNGESESARVAAATALLDRGFGRPAQVVEGKDGGAAVLIQIVEPCVTSQPGAS